MAVTLIAVTTPEGLPQQPPKKRPTALIIGAAAGVVVLLAAAIAITVAVTGGDQQPKTSDAAKPSTFTVTGQIKLSLPGFTWSETARTCTGRLGYDDIKGGAQVVIRDGSGATVSVGALDAGVPAVDATTQRAGDCTLKFTVPNVPAGKGFYSVEVSHRGQMQYPEAGMRGYLQLTLGS